MAKRTEHTPTLPWKADESDDYWILGGVLSGKVAEVTFPEDRPLVVRAVNCHADLVAALEAALFQMEIYPDHTYYAFGHDGRSKRHWCDLCDRIDDARAALAKAKKR